MRPTDKERIEDYVSREVVLSLLRYWGGVYMNDKIMEMIESLPPVTPTEKTGRWVAERYCSECEWDKKDAELVCNIPTNYCPNCGADMRGKE